MGSRISPYLVPSSPDAGQAAVKAVVEQLASLIQAAGSTWQALTAPISGVPSKDVISAFATRVGELAAQLPGALQGMSIDPGTESWEYILNPSPPPPWCCVHRADSSVSFATEGYQFRLAFSVPCTDCLS